jgi:hypothetical protein
LKQGPERFTIKIHVCQDGEDAHSENKLDEECQEIEITPRWIYKETDRCHENEQECQ